MGGGPSKIMTLEFDGSDFIAMMPSAKKLTGNSKKKKRIEKEKKT